MGISVEAVFSVCGGLHLYSLPQRRFVSLPECSESAIAISPRPALNSSRSIFSVCDVPRTAAVGRSTLLFVRTIALSQTPSTLTSHGFGLLVRSSQQQRSTALGASNRQSNPQLANSPRSRSVCQSFVRSFLHSRQCSVTFWGSLGALTPSVIWIGTGRQI